MATASKLPAMLTEMKERVPTFIDSVDASGQACPEMQLAEVESTENFFAYEFYDHHSKKFNYMTLDELETHMSLSRQMAVTLKSTLVPEKTGVLYNFYPKTYDGTNAKIIEGRKKENGKYHILKPTRNSTNVGKFDFTHKRFYMMISIEWSMRRKNSKDFKVNPKNYLATAAGIDPVSHPLEYILYSTGLDYCFFMYPLEVSALCIWRYTNSSALNLRNGPDIKPLIRQRNADKITAFEIIQSSQEKVSELYRNYNDVFRAGAGKAIDVREAKIVAWMRESGILANPTYIGPTTAPPAMPGFMKAHPTH